MNERNGTYLFKTCSQCQVPLRADGGAFELVRRSMVASEAHTGIPVSVYSCPKCGHIELYNLRIIATI